MNLRYILDISPEIVDVIQREIEKGGYRSVQEFIINAVQNQIYLVDNPVDVYTSNEFSQKVIETSQEMKTSTNHLVLEKTEFSTVKPNTELLQPILSGFWNKFLPSKITVRVLSSLLREQNQVVPLALLQEQASLEARAIGLKLVRTEKKSGRKRGDRLFTGLPVKKNNEKSRLRFKAHFVGSLKKKNIDGMTGTLRLINIYRGKDGKDYVQLTNFGKEFADLENPILDNKDYTDSLSEEEREYLIKLIKNQLKKIILIIHQ